MTIKKIALAIAFIVTAYVSGVYFAVAATQPGIVPYITAYQTNATSSFLGGADLSVLDLSGKFYDRLGSPGANGYVLQSNGSGVTWVATSTLGTGSGSGSVTSVAMTVPTGLTVSGSPITTTGTLAVAYDTGYTGVLTASTSEWAKAYASSTSLSATSPLAYNGQTGAFSITANGIGDTQLAFDTGQALTTLSSPTFAGLTITPLTSALLVTDGSGVLAEYAGTSCTNQFVRAMNALGVATCATVANTDLANSSVSYGGVSVSLGGSDATPAFDLTDATNLPISTGVSGLGSNVATWLATPSSANLLSALTDETGSGFSVFSVSPTLTGTANLANYIASNGTTTNASSTNLYLSGRFALGTTTPWATAAIQATVGQTNPIFQVASSSNAFPFLTVGGNGTTTIQGPTAATSSIYVFSSSAGRGAQLILEDYDGAGCTSVVALNGVLTAAIANCPPEN